jgi:predicted DsbA family dithiol-disulfide isomerase
MRQTIRVHRLLYLAYKRGGMALQQRLLALLFQDFFEQPDPFTIDVTSVPQLAAYAVEIGLIPDRAAAEAWLNSRAGEEDVRRLAKISNDCGISGVPFTVVEGKWAIGGGMERGIYYKASCFCFLHYLLISMILTLFILQFL